MQSSKRYLHNYRESELTFCTFCSTVTAQGIFFELRGYFYKLRERTHTDLIPTTSHHIMLYIYIYIYIYIYTQHYTNKCGLDDTNCRIHSTVCTLYVPMSVNPLYNPVYVSVLTPICVTCGAVVVLTDCGCGLGVGVLIQVLRHVTERLQAESDTNHTLLRGFRLNLTQTTHH